MKRMEDENPYQASATDEAAETISDLPKVERHYVRGTFFALASAFYFYDFTGPLLKMLDKNTSFNFMDQNDLIFSFLLASFGVLTSLFFYRGRLQVAKFFMWLLILQFALFHLVSPSLSGNALGVG